jgi:hypothetical protein
MVIRSALRKRKGEEGESVKEEEEEGEEEKIYNIGGGDKIFLWSYRGDGTLV